MARTKILATLGPASFDRIEQLMSAGVDGFRLNMSHVSPEGYASNSELVEKIRKLDENIFLVGDLQGPKIRLGDFKTVNVTVGDKVSIIPSSESGGGIPIQCNEVYQHVSPGNILLIDDGNVGLRVRDVRKKEILCEVEYGRVIEARKGVNIPNVSIPMEYLAEKDKRDLDFLVKNNFHYVSASYSRTAEDILQVRKFAGDGILIIGKPENYEGEINLQQIVEAADAMMVPRGDFGMEQGVENVPAFQKRLIELCNIRGKMVITATQMLESMMDCKEPKRAEVSDIFNAVLDGSDVLMLSGETSKGNYPIETVQMMNRILGRAEEYLFDKTNGINLGEKMNKLIAAESVSDIVSKSVYAASNSDGIKAVIVPTHKGTTARMISRFRIEQPIIAVCYDPVIRRRLNACWGVIPISTKNKDEKCIVEDSIERAKLAGYVKIGDKVIVTAGIGSYETGNTNMMRIEKIK